MPCLSCSNARHICSPLGSRLHALPILWQLLARPLRSMCPRRPTPRLFARWGGLPLRLRRPLLMLLPGRHLPAALRPSYERGLQGRPEASCCASGEGAGGAKNAAAATKASEATGAKATDAKACGHAKEMGSPAEGNGAKCRLGEEGAVRRPGLLALPLLLGMLRLLPRWARAACAWPGLRPWMCPLVVLLVGCGPMRLACMSADPAAVGHGWVGACAGGGGSALAGHGRLGLGCQPRSSSDAVAPSLVLPLSAELLLLLAVSLDEKLQLLEHSLGAPEELPPDAV